MADLKRILWISDWFPRPHDATLGTWSLDTVVSIQQQGVDVPVLAPTPWIPRWLAPTPGLRAWADAPLEWRIKGIRAVYPKCPHYPHRFVIRGLYNHLPGLETGPVWAACRGAVEQLLREAPIQVVHTNFLFPSGYLGMAIKARHGIPLVVNERSVPRFEAAMAHPLRRRMYRRILDAADRVVVSGHPLAERLNACMGGRLAMEVVPEGMHLNGAGGTAAPRPAAWGDRTVILSVGALVPRKGHAYLLRAMAVIRGEIPNLLCVIVGRGPARPALERLIRDLGLEGVVELYGQRPREEVLGLMAGCDLFALPSWNETFGTVYVEAMSRGKPIIGCRGEGISRVMRDGVHGAVVPPRDAEALGRALTQILRDPQRAAAMGRDARRLVEEELDYRVIGRRLVRMYHDLL